MSVKIITGQSGEEHINASDDGAINIGLIGSEQYVLPVGEAMSYRQVSENLIRINAGFAVNQGRFWGIPYREYEDVEIDNGLPGTKRRDLIVARYKRDSDTGLESVNIIAIKGKSGSDYVSPEIIEGDIYKGAKISDMLLYEVNLNGLFLESVNPLFTKMPDNLFNMFERIINLEKNSIHHINNKPGNNGNIELLPSDIGALGVYEKAKSASVADSLSDMITIKGNNGELVTKLSKETVIDLTTILKTTGNDDSSESDETTWSSKKILDSLPKKRRKVISCVLNDVLVDDIYNYIYIKPNDTAEKLNTGNCFQIVRASSDIANELLNFNISSETIVYVMPDDSTVKDKVLYSFQIHSKNTGVLVGKNLGKQCHKRSLIGMSIYNGEKYYEYDEYYMDYDIPFQYDYSQNSVPASRKINNKNLSEDITLNASDVNADSQGTAQSLMSTHNTDTAAHNDIRLLITDLTNRLNALADSDDDTLDQMSEIVAYIKSNKALIDSITTSKINVSDIIDNLTTNVSNKTLSAAQGVVLKKLIDDLQNEVNNKVDETDLTAHTGNTESHVTASERENWNNAFTHSESVHAPTNAQENIIEKIQVNGSELTPSDKTVNIVVPTKISELENDSGYSDTDTKYTVGRGLMLDGTAFRIADICTDTVDWNAATANGYYMGCNAYNAPFRGENGSTIWFFGEVIAHNLKYLRQILYRFGTSGDINHSDCDRYERVCQNGVWGEWVNTSVRNYLPLSGGTMTGKITERQGHYVHNTQGVAGKKGYVAVATISIKGTYANQPFELIFARRAEATPTKLSIVFKNDNGTDPDISNFSCMGSSAQAYLYKTGTSTWKLYIKKMEAYDNIAILDFSQGAYSANGVSVTWLDELSETLPDGAIQADWGYTVGTAQNAEKLGGYTPVADNVTGNTVVLRNSSGQVHATHFCQTSNLETPTDSSQLIFANSDGFFRKSSLANIKSILGLGDANKIGYRYEWTAIVKGVTWSRLCYVPVATSIVGCSYILNICATRNQVVYNDTFIVKTHHKENGKIIKISGNNYAYGYQIRLIVDSTGNSYVELYDNVNNITSSATQPVYCALIPIYCGIPTMYTSVTDGTTLPANFSVKQTMVLTNADMQGNLYGNATTATIATEAKKLTGDVTAQWSGQISSTDWFAAFNPDVNGQIRCISVENVKKVLGVGESVSSPLGTVYNIIWSGHTYVYSYNSSYTDISVNVNNIFAYSYLILEGNIHYPDSGYNPTHRFTVPLMLGKNVINDGQNIVKGVLPVFELIDQNYAIYNKLNIVLSELEYKISSDILSVISFKLNPNSGFGVVLGGGSDGVISAKYSDEVYFSISQICGVA